MSRSFRSGLWLGLIFCSASRADKIQNYSGEARSKGKVIYTENHRVTYSATGQLLAARTEYLDLNKKPIGLLESDFRASVAVPDYRMTHLISGDVEGLRRENGQLLMFQKDHDKKEVTKVVDLSANADRVVMGGQGFSYYVLEHLEEIKKAKTLSIKILFPGKLDAYDFEVSAVANAQPSLSEFKIKINSWVLRLFAPSLRIRFDTVKNRIAWYDGLSNLKDARGKTQRVEIVYQ